MDVINLPCFVLLSVLAQGDEVHMMGVIWLIVSVSCKSCRADLQKVGDFEVSLYHHIRVNDKYAPGGHCITPSMY